MSLYWLLSAVGCLLVLVALVPNTRKLTGYLAVGGATLVLVGVYHAIHVNRVMLEHTISFVAEPSIERLCRASAKESLRLPAGDWYRIGADDVVWKDNVCTRDRSCPRTALVTKWLVGSPDRAKAVGLVYCSLDITERYDLPEVTFDLQPVD